MSSRKAELLLTVDRSGPDSLQMQVERQLREAIQRGMLRAGSEIPSTRDLARDLEISRPLVMEAYAQLAAEGYIALRQGAAPRVAESAAQAPARELPPETISTATFRYDFRPGKPDLSSFPATRWLKAVEAALKAMVPGDFGYGQRFGVLPLRQVLADYLGRVRGVSADPRQILITGGFEQARSFLARALRRRGVTHLAVEEPGYTDRAVWLAAGLKLVPIPVDENGMDIAALARSKAQTVLLTPAHQYPTGGVMSGARRLALAGWLRDKDAVAIEDDYDAEFRYDRSPVGALQGLAPDHVIYAGTASKTLAPALRLGWMVAPPDLLLMLEDEVRQIDYGRGRIDQFALAHFIRTGDYDRHLRKMRALYRDRREALLALLSTELPEVEIGGISAGLHVTARFPRLLDEAAIMESANKRDIGVSFMREHYIGAVPDQSTLLLSYANMPESALRTGLRALAMIIDDRPATPPLGPR
ncbi:GntR family transcriptional regulator [Devosia yakushimensis]|uniref:GntR family transcriptional regulator n=1 Tax=Devosia yakushimensis TaxID=470028 RepID=A0ABQ5UHE2_9HYPH|nr:PLP-dependent aminotransferase family protein [Devosia yakushimensis]GLQ10615.1 GntR family transcriptional regulator [Devosia yakushimensis]